MEFKEWLASLQPRREHTPGEDLADSIALFVICGLLYLCIFL